MNGYEDGTFRTGSAGDQKRGQGEAPLMCAYQFSVFPVGFCVGLLVRRYITPSLTWFWVAAATTATASYAALFLPDGSPWQFIGLMLEVPAVAWMTAHGGALDSYSA